MSDGEKAGNWFSTIPEVHYDFLARVMPGFVVLSFVGALCTEISPPSVSKDSILSNVLTLSLGPGLTFLILLVLASWCIGMFLTPIGEWMLRMLFLVPIFRKFVKENAGSLNEAHKIDFVFALAKWPEKRNRGEWLCLADIIYRDLHDGLKELNATASAVLSKNQGEAAFYENTTAGLLVFVLGWLVFLSYQHFHPSIETIPKLPISVLAAMITLPFWFRGVYRRQQRLWNRHASFLRMYLRVNRSKVSI